jgi:nucleoside phosphorylase
MSAREKNLARLVPDGAENTAEWTKKFNPQIQNTPAIPAVNWSAVGAAAPTLLTTPSGDLPAADAVVICWTDAEWAATVHAFCNSQQSMSYSSRNDSSWSGWQKYTKGIHTQPEWDYWAEYRLVQVASKKVLLFKSNTHLDFPGQTYLTQLIELVIQNVKPTLILSTGTAGGARPSDHVGTVNAVRAATMDEKTGSATSWPKYSSPWKAGWSTVSKGGFSKLLFPVPTTSADIDSIRTQFNSFYGSNFSMADLNPGNVNMADAQPAVNNLTSAGTPLLTTTSFVVATSAGNFKDFACVEMDDAVIAQICVGKNVEYGSVRNISDPVQGASLPSEMQAHWGQAIYNTYCLYTAYNGAIAAWAILNA